MYFAVLNIFANKNEKNIITGYRPAFGGVCISIVQKIK
jgi:hypothetical protein